MNFYTKDYGQPNRNGRFVAVDRQPVWCRVAVNAFGNHGDRYINAGLKPCTGAQLAGDGFNQLRPIAGARTMPRRQRLPSR